MKLIETTKKNVKQNWQATRVVTSNFAEFVDAACLAGVAGFAIYSSLHKKEFWYRALLFAGLVIALQAFLLLVKK
jgi:hypothetical protein